MPNISTNFKKIIIFVWGPEFNKKKWYVTWVTNEINALFRFPFPYLNGYRMLCLTMLVFLVPNLLKNGLKNFFIYSD